MSLCGRGVVIMIVSEYVHMYSSKLLFIDRPIDLPVPTHISYLPLQRRQASPRRKAKETPSSTPILLVYVKSYLPSPLSPPPTHTSPLLTSQQRRTDRFKEAKELLDARELAYTEPERSVPTGGDEALKGQKQEDTHVPSEGKEGEGGKKGSKGEQMDKGGKDDMEKAAWGTQLRRLEVQEHPGSPPASAASIRQWSRGKDW